MSTRRHHHHPVRKKISSIAGDFSVYCTRLVPYISSLQIDEDVIYVWHFLYGILLIKTMVILLVQNVRILLYLIWSRNPCYLSVHHTTSRVLDNLINRNFILLAQVFCITYTIYASMLRARFRFGLLLALRSSLMQWPALLYVITHSAASTRRMSWCIMQAIKSCNASHYIAFAFPSY